MCWFIITYNVKVIGMIQYWAGHGRWTPCNLIRRWARDLHGRNGKLSSQSRPAHKECRHIGPYGRTISTIPGHCVQPHRIYTQLI